MAGLRVRSLYLYVAPIRNHCQAGILYTAGIRDRISLFYAAAIRNQWWYTVGKELPDVLSVAQAAEVLGLPERTIQHRLNRELMAGVRVGKRTWAISRAEVE